MMVFIIVFCTQNFCFTVKIRVRLLNKHSVAPGSKLGEVYESEGLSIQIFRDHLNTEFFVWFFCFYGFFAFLTYTASSHPSYCLELKLENMYCIV